jgi:excisionase family DNA binding protein
MPEELYTVEAAAERLKLHVKTVLRLIRDGRLRATKIGRAYRIQRSDLESLAGGPLASKPDARATCIVDMEDVDAQTGQHIASYVSVSQTNRTDRSGQMSVDVAHDLSQRRLKVIMVGSPTDVAAMLQLLRAFTGG